MKINSIILFIFLYSFVFGQEKDSQTWMSFSIDKKIIKKTEFSLKYSLRFEDNSSFLYKNFTDLKIKYNYNKKLTLSFGFRNINEWEDELDKEHKNRYYSDLYFRQKVERFKINIRNRFQRQGLETSFINTFRQKLSIIFIE